MDNLDNFINQQNPHWLSGPAVLPVTKDHLRDIYPQIWEHLTSNRLITLIHGPRRMGKSYLLRQLQFDLMQQHRIPASDILYLQFTTLSNQPRIIQQILDLFLQKFSSSDTPKYIFFDEIQYLNYWQDQIKLYYDQNPRLKFIITGSLSLFYKQPSRESLLGRFNKFHLNTLNFPEYLKFRSLSPPISSVNLSAASPDQQLYQQWLTYQTRLKSDFLDYLTRGQYPELALNLPAFQYQQYLDDILDQLLNYDIPYLHQTVDRVLFLNLFKTLCADLANEYSLNNLAHQFGTDRRTIGEYLKIMEEIGLVQTVYNQAFKSKRRQLSGSKKIYLFNSNLALQVNHFDANPLQSSRIFGQYFENYAARRISELFPHLAYYRLQNREVDFITDQYLFEVKSGQSHKLEKYLELATKLKRKLVILTSSEYEITSEYSQLPLYLL